MTYNLRGVEVLENQRFRWKFRGFVVTQKAGETKYSPPRLETMEITCFISNGKVHYATDGSIWKGMTLHKINADPTSEITVKEASGNG